MARTVHALTITVLCPAALACAADHCRTSVGNITVNGVSHAPTFQSYGPGKLVFKVTKLGLDYSNADGVTVTFSLWKSRTCSTLDLFLAQVSAGSARQTHLHMATGVEVATRSAVMDAQHSHLTCFAYNFPVCRPNSLSWTRTPSAAPSMTWLAASCAAWHKTPSTIAAQSQPVMLSRELTCRWLVLLA